MTRAIDLNSDLGEQADSSLDREIMPYISSCNIACGSHAGNRDSILRTIELALNHNIIIGGHPSFPDRENFGREIIKISDRELADSLGEQIALIRTLAGQSGAEVTHIKPHGALYNLAAAEKKYARIVADVIQEIDPNLKLFGLAHSVSEEVAKSQGLKFIGEAFADRRYVGKNLLMSRKIAGAVLDDEREVLAQVENLVFKKKVEAMGGSIEIDAKTICLHSDTKGSVLLAKSIHTFIVDKGAQITSF